MSLSLETAPRSHRPNEAQDHYLARLARARLKKPELREIELIYARLDADRTAHGLPPAERAPWSPADILEWQDLTPAERFLDLETFALAADRAANAPPAITADRSPSQTYRVLNKSTYARPCQPVQSTSDADRNGETPSGSAPMATAIRSSPNTRNGWPIRTNSCAPSTNCAGITSFATAHPSPVTATCF